MDTELLSIDQLRTLPEDTECSGVYFLWNGPDLQYIGQSRSVGSRLQQHTWNYRYGHLRLHRPQRIKFDRCTVIVIDRRPYMSSEELEHLAKRMLSLEAAYITKHPTRFNRAL